MALLERLKNNSTTFQIKTKEEIDLLFSEMETIGQRVDDKLDFHIRMSIQKVKLQLYYELKLGEYKQKGLVHNGNKSDSSEEKLFVEDSAKGKTKKKKKRKGRSLEQYDEWAKGKTKEELIAINKAKVAQYHPKPDLSTISPKIAKERQKIKHEKEMLEKTKNQWTSIVSIPMGGMNK